MKLLGALSFISLAAAIPHHLDFQWHAWKHQNKLHFPRSEEFRRYKNFAENRDFVNQHNKRAAQGQESYVVSLNKFAHMSHDEFYNMYLKPNEYSVADKQDKGIVLEYQCTQNSFSTDNNPDQVSYVNNGPNNLTPPSVLVSTVKDQGSCGSCWTFGAGAAIEAAACAAGQQDCSTWQGVAAQQLVDCASYNNELNPYDSHGCSGGFQSNALRYVSDFSGGINMWANYPYVSGTTKKEGTCVFDNTAAMVSISGCGMPAPNNEPQLVAALANVGPLTIAIDASGIGFQLYTGGVYTSNTCSSTRLNHAVTATGYGTLNGADYFEVKNSWGTGWGNSGYIDMARNAGNMCGVAADTQYAIIA